MTRLRCVFDDNDNDNSKCRTCFESVGSAKCHTCLLGLINKTRERWQSAYHGNIHETPRVVLHEEIMHLWLHANADWSHTISHSLALTVIPLGQTLSDGKRWYAQNLTLLAVQELNPRELMLPPDVLVLQVFGDVQGK